MVAKILPMFRIFAFSHFHILHGKKCENGKMLIFDQNFSFSHFRFFFFHGNCEHAKKCKCENRSEFLYFCIFPLAYFFHGEKCENGNIRKCENPAWFSYFSHFFKGKMRKNEFAKMRKSCPFFAFSKFHVFLHRKKCQNAKMQKCKNSLHWTTLP